MAAIYRRALPHVYGYLLSRCGSVSLAEDLTADTFMAAVAAVREERTLAAASQPAQAHEDPWEEWGWTPRPRTPRWAA